MKRKILPAILAVCIIFPCLCWSLSPAFAVAETIDVTNYSNVLDDLSADDSFDIEQYPEIEGDYSLDIKHIAESSDGELFLYVYQPAGNNVRSNATSINLALSESVRDVKNYKLLHLNSSGTLHKYLVEGVTVSDTQTIRIYYITSIYRYFISGVDDEVKDNTTSEVAFAVAQSWKAITVNDVIVYDCQPLEILEVTEQFVDYFRYSEGFQWGGVNSCDAHYFVFNCVNDIDYLLSCDIEFYTQTYKRLEGQDIKFTQENPVFHSVTITAEMHGNSKKETWQRMCSVSEFLSKHDVANADEKATLRQYTWMINFYETEYERDVGGKDILISLLVPGGFVWTIVNACTTKGTLVSDVTLMRLEFSYNGDIYNLGVVSNKQTSIRDHDGDEWENFKKDWNDFWGKVRDFFVDVGNWCLEYWWVIAIVVALILFGTFGWIFKPFGKALLVGFKWTGKGLYYVVSAPARLIVLIASKIMERHTE